MFLTPWDVKFQVVMHFDLLFFVEVVYVMLFSFDVFSPFFFHVLDYLTFSSCWNFSSFISHFSNHFLLTEFHVFTPWYFKLQVVWLFDLLFFVEVVYVMLLMVLNVFSPFFSHVTFMDLAIQLFQVVGHLSSFIFHFPNHFLQTEFYVFFLPFSSSLLILIKIL